MKIGRAGDSANDVTAVSGTATGWTCSSCGQWVTMGILHTCPVYVPYDNYTYWPSPPPVLAWFAEFERSPYETNVLLPVVLWVDVEEEYSPDSARVGLVASNEAGELLIRRPDDEYWAERELRFVRYVRQQV